MKHLKLFEEFHNEHREDDELLLEGIGSFFKGLLKKFPTIESWYIRTFGKPKFSSTRKEGKSRSVEAKSKTLSARSRMGFNPQGSVESALREFDNYLLKMFQGTKESKLAYRIQNLLNKQNVQKIFSNYTGGYRFLLSESGSERKGIYLDQLLTILQAWKNKLISTADVVRSVPLSTIDNPKFRNDFEDLLLSQAPKLEVDFKGSLQAFKNYIQKKYPMSKQEAESYLKKYGWDKANDDVSRLGIWPNNRDYRVVAAYLKNMLSMPIEPYLYHGTTTEALESIAKNGINPSLQRQPANPGGPGTNTETHFFATADIMGAKEFSELGAKNVGADPIIVRFANTEQKHLGWSGTLRHKGLKGLEWSFDGGKNWTKKCPVINGKVVKPKTY